MCGIVGLIATKPLAIAEVLRSMTARLAHRGPDDEGTWLDDSAGIGFGHRRLSIVDLSPQGHQPMTSKCGRYVITFNGEIYNHLEIKLLLQREAFVHASEWRGRSDTEVALAAVAAWGVDDSIRLFVGMFA